MNTTKWLRMRLAVVTVTAVVFTESLAIMGLIVMIRSLTRKSRARLRASEERYRSIVEDGSELVCRFDREEKIVFANGAMSRLAVVPVDAIVGRSFWSVLRDPDQEGNQRRIATLTPDAPVLSMEQPSTVAEGDQRWVLWTYRGLFGAHGQLSEVQAVGHDITDRREAELALQAALRKVEEGNARIARSNESLQGILDSMHEGLLVCDRRGVLTATRSRALVEWFGEPAAGALIWDYVFKDDSRTKEHFEMAFEQLSADMLPFELATAQLPQSWRRCERSYGLACHRVFHNGHFTEVLFVIADITAQLAQSMQLQRNHELTTIVGNVMRNRGRYRDLIEECEQLLATLRTERNAVLMRRSLHTLKGIAATYGFAIFAAHCHALEDAIKEDPREPTSASIEALVQEWNASVAGVRALLTDEDDAVVHLRLAEYNDFLFRLESHGDPAQVAGLLQIARRWLNPPMSQLLGVFAKAAKQVAAKLGKDVELHVLDHGLRLPLPEQRGFFSTLVHVARNCVDHGIEPPHERQRLGKARAGRITIESRLQGAEFVVIVQDDGQGIDWDAVRRQASMRSLPASEMGDLVNALFTDGLSTRDVVSETSGRGVGLGAVRRSCESLGGSLSVTSNRGQGTRFEFRFPVRATDFITPENSIERNGALAS